MLFFVYIVFLLFPPDVFCDFLLNFDQSSRTVCAVFLCDSTVVVFGQFPVFVVVVLLQFVGLLYLALRCVSGETTRLHLQRDSEHLD